MYTCGLSTWFGVKGLIATGSTWETCGALRAAVGFLLSKQLPCGGWGESYLSCQNKKYVHLPGLKPHVVNTSWAVLSLVAAGQAARDAVGSARNFSNCPSTHLPIVAS